MKKLLLVAAVVGALPFAANAESTLSSATSGTMSATARLDFVVTVPKVLFLQVGTGTAGATIDKLGTNGAINDMTFAVPAGSIGTGATTGAIAATGGDLAGGGVTVRVFGNSGNVSLSNATTGQLSSGTAGNPTIPWTDIAVTSGTLAATTTGYTNSAIAHPPFNNASGGGASATPTSLTATNGLVRREGSWTFAYANTAMLPSGTYGNTVANNGTVTYTATAP